MITYYHNPRCSTSRKGLELLRTRGIEPTIIDYLKNPPSREHWQALIAKSGLPVDDFLRRKEDLYKTLKLDQADDATRLDALAAHPILLNRPVGENATRVRIGRPPENLLELLE